MSSPETTFHLLTVVGGTGGGDFSAGETVAVVADIPAAGQVFARWIVSPGGTDLGTNFFATLPSTTITMPINDVTLTALYEAGIYTVTFDPEGGAVSPSGATVTNGVAYGALPVPTLTGFVFAGWWTGDNGTGSQVTESTVVTAVADHTLYAKWIRDADVLYMVIDLAGGTNAASYPVTYTDSIPVGGWTDDYKTTKLVMRKVPAGTFNMGSLAGELGRNELNEPQHSVTLTKGFYIGVFEITQRQWELVMGNRPSQFTYAACYASRPVEQVSYNTVRGASAGANWPLSDSVDSASFMGRLRARTGTVFDLPTEAQWEYACRAGTATALNSGKNLTVLGVDANMAEVGRYWYNGGQNYGLNGDTSGGSAKVGSFIPNTWGLYDMHGNVYEWCLDWFGDYPVTASDPKGGTLGTYRLIRGGSWFSGNDNCRSAHRGNSAPEYSYGHVGFRVVAPVSSPLSAYHRLTVIGGAGSGDFAAGDTASVVADAPAAGQTFARWTVSPEGTDLGTNFFATLSSTTVAMPSNDVTLVAMFEGSRYTLTFDPEGGTVSPLSATVTNGSVYGTMPVPALSGYAFSGWWTGDNGTGSQVSDSTVVTAVADHTLYAKWVLNADVLYMVVDLSGGTNAASYPVTYLNSIPVGGWTDEYKTAKLVLRKISAGAFTMGSPVGELGRATSETQHAVTLTKDYFVSVFGMTQRQWELVVGTRPSYFNNVAYYASRPVEQVSYNDIRGTVAGKNWPANSNVDAGSFLGILRAKTKLFALDLPTEAQWEYACRAGVSTALNSGKNLTNVVSDASTAEVGRYLYNGGSGFTQNGNTSVGTAAVGSYLPNAWGLYDMHGNTWQWCLDWSGTYSGAATDPKGVASGIYRVLRSGSMASASRDCRSANRNSVSASYRSRDVGFRVVMTSALYNHLTVVNGTGGGDYIAGTETNVIANTPPAGQVFARWTVSPEGTDLGTNFIATLPSTAITMPSHDVTLTALYEAGRYTVTFDPEGGAVNPSGMTVTNGALYGILPEPTRAGYGFAGWWTGDNGTGWQVAEFTTVSAVADYTLYARWTQNAEGLYLVIDLSGGTNAASYPVTYLDSVPLGGWSDEFRTDKLVLRKISAGSFTMGSPSGELGHETDIAVRDETQHAVTLTKDYYIGVFEVTQRQWEHVMGSNPSGDAKTNYYTVLPVEHVSYDAIRGSSAGAGWPGSKAVDATSFMGTIRAKTGLSTFDLPTEAQWEYACRAGTATALNSGKDLTGLASCPNLAEVGRYYHNGGSGTVGVTARVGSYLPNAWGLYDMHGNVYESCLDWFGVYSGPVTDPGGALTGTRRIERGGGWGDRTGYCRSAFRGHDFASQASYYVGFRVAWNLSAYRLTVNGGTGSGDFAAGETASVVADVPAADQTFLRWTVSPEGTDLGTNFFVSLPSTTVTMPSNDVTLTAVFLNWYPLTYLAGTFGTVTGAVAQTVAQGEAGTPVVAVPNAGYRFLRWSDGRTDNPRTDAGVLAAVSVTALFGGVSLAAETFPCSEADGTVDVVVVGGLADAACSVQLYVQPGSATLNADYVSATKPVTVAWAAGEIGPKTVKIPIKQDLTVEGPESFYVVLGQPARCALVEPSVGTVVISDDDLGTVPGKGVFVSCVPQPPEGGRVSGGGYCLPGRTVRVSATPGKGWTLLHWENGSQDTVRLVSASEATAGAEDGVKLCTAFFGITTNIAPPQVVNPGAQQARVGVRYEKVLEITSDSLPKVTVTGLPAGLKYDASTKTISGVPLAPSVTDKPSQVKVSVTNAGNRSTPVTVSFTITVSPLPKWAVGVFNGYLENERVFGRGTATMTVTAQGRITGKIAAAGTNYSFSADSYLAVSSDSEFSFATKVSASNAKATIPLSVVVCQEQNPGGPAALGVALEQVADPVNEVPSLMLFRDVSGDADMRTTVTNLNGYYTATAQSGQEVLEDGAETYGSGYLSLTVSNGKVKSVGKLADGTAVSLSSPLIIRNEHALFTVLYTSPVAYRGGSFYGVVVFDRDSGPKTCVTVSDVIVWENRSANAFVRTLDLTGGWYDKVGNLYDYYRNKVLSVGVGAPAPSPVLNVGTNRYESAWWNPDGLPLSVKLNSSGLMTGITAPVAGTPLVLAGGGWDYTVNENAEALSVSLIRATGLFSGTFKAWFDYGATHTAKSVRFEGIMTPVRLSPSDGIEGRGFFLWSDKEGLPSSQKANARNQSYDFLIRSQEIEP